jgi:hypothetical protein
MDNKIILEVVGKNLEEIKLLVESLRNEEKIDPLLIEITTIKAKTLYQELMLLTPDESFDHQKDEYIASNDAQVSENNIPDIPDPEPIVENENLQIAEIETSNIEIQELTIIETETVVNHQQSIDENEIVKEVETITIQNSESILIEKNEEPKIEIQEKKLLGEQFTNEPSIYEKLAASLIHESKVKGKPVTNIKNAIGLNDRFLFARELFSNDIKSFENTIDQLDRLNNFLEAIDFLEKNFQWTKNEASLKFMDLVKRRFEN